MLSGLVPTCDCATASIGTTTNGACTASASISAFSVAACAILADAGVTTPPMLDWFHVAMRLRHLKQIAGALPADDPARGRRRRRSPPRSSACTGASGTARPRMPRSASIVSARSCTISGASRISEGLQHLHGSCGAPCALDGCLTGQSAGLANYAERHRAGLRADTAITEGTANVLVNRRMNKSQQMRWSRRGADLLLQVWCAVYNGTLGSGFGQRFQPAHDPYSPMAIAACPPILRRSLQRPRKPLQ